MADASLFQLPKGKRIVSKYTYFAAKGLTAREADRVARELKIESFRAAGVDWVDIDDADYRIAEWLQRQRAEKAAQRDAEARTTADTPAPAATPAAPLQTAGAASDRGQR